MTGPGRHALYLLFTPALCARDPWWTLDAALDGGVDLVQWRPKADDPDGARRCLERCSVRGVPVIVDDDVALAARIGAAGAHVGQHDMPAAEARALLGPDRWLGVSTHDLDELARAVADGADHVGFGPMFPTATKGYSDGQPTGALRAILATSSVPVFAIGGITPGNVGLVVAEGCRRVVVGGAILGAPDPAATAAELRRALRA